MKKIIILFFLVSSLSCTSSNDKFIKSPFSNLDTLSTNDWWNRDNNPIINLKVERDQVIAFGIYTVSKNVLKLTAQLFPLYPNESREVILEIFKSNNWIEIGRKDINEIGWTTTFKVDNWDDSKDVRYRLLHGKNAKYEGLIRKNPLDKEIITMAAFSCNSNKDRGNRDNYINNINHIDPKLKTFLIFIVFT